MSTLPVMCWCEASWGQLRGADQCGCKESSPWLLQVLPGHETIPGVSDPNTTSIKPLQHPGVSNQKKFVFSAAVASEIPIPLENRGSKRGYTFLSRGLLTMLF